jgi:membrane-bound lytic murein transglycosylase A
VLPAPAILEPITFSDLAEWPRDDHGAALAAFRRSARRVTEATAVQRPAPTPGRAFLEAAQDALASRPGANARTFFEGRFAPHRVVVAGSSSGLLTGYYEPEIEGRLVAEDGFRAPLLGRPDDLVSFLPGEAPAGLPRGLAAARRTAAGLEPYPDRAAIEDGALAGRGLELVHLRDPVDAFFAQVQGSVRIRLRDGKVLRLGYAGRNGQPYTAIGRILLEEGALSREAITMQTIRAWLAANPEAGKALMRRNRSYVFFSIDETLGPSDGPRGGEGVPLTPGRSLAIDRAIWPYGLPFWIEGSLPALSGGADEKLARLTIAQDTGSAIISAARGDLFVGSGEAAGALAGLLKHPARFVVLLPLAGEPRR